MSQHDDRHAPAESYIRFYHGCVEALLCVDVCSGKPERNAVSRKADQEHEVGTALYWHAGILSCLFKVFTYFVAQLIA